MHRCQSLFYPDSIKYLKQKVDIRSVPDIILMMYTQPKECPKCKATGKFFIKKGYYKNKNDHQPVPRYQCKACKKFFGSHTSLPTYRQKKPQLNHQIYQLYASATSMRRLARVLKCNLKTVANKLFFIASQARLYHENHIQNKGIQTSYVQFDEMETFEHTRLKPLSVAIAVRSKMLPVGKSQHYSEIIDIKVATMNSHGHNSALAQQIYGIRPDTRVQACEDVLKTVAKCQRFGDTLTIRTDAKRAYISSIQKILPTATHQSVLSRATPSTTSNPMFPFNVVAGKIRHDMSRMARRSWVTTKSIRALEAHLDLYIAWNNRYPIFQTKAGTV